MFMNMWCSHPNTHKNPLPSVQLACVGLSLYSKAFRVLRLETVLLISVSLTPGVIAGLCNQPAQEMIE